MAHLVLFNSSVAYFNVTFSMSVLQLLRPEQFLIRWYFLEYGPLHT
jgi:hypothetical protein